MRKRTKQDFRSSIALVVDGDDEMWYMENVKKHYPSTLLKRMKISPEFPKHKKVEELFAFAQDSMCRVLVSAPLWKDDEVLC